MFKDKSECLYCRIDLAKPDQLNQIELGRKDDSKVHKLFLDPTGKKIQHWKVMDNTALTLYKELCLISDSQTIKHHITVSLYSDLC